MALARGEEALFLSGALIDALRDGGGELRDDDRGGGYTYTLPDILAVVAEMNRAEMRVVDGKEEDGVTEAGVVGRRWTKVDRGTEARQLWRGRRGRRMLGLIFAASKHGGVLTVSPPQPIRKRYHGGCWSGARAQGLGHVEREVALGIGSGGGCWCLMLVLVLSLLGLLVAVTQKREGRGGKGSTPSAPNCFIAGWPRRARDFSRGTPLFSA